MASIVLVLAPEAHMADTTQLPPPPTPGKAEGEREPGQEGPIAPHTPGQAEGEREQRREKK